MYCGVSFCCCRFDVSVSQSEYTLQRRMRQFNFGALNIPNNVTFLKYIVFQYSDVHEKFHL